MVTHTYKFNPQPKQTARSRRRGGPQSNFMPRVTPYHQWAKRPLNEIVLGRLFGMLHSKLGHGLPIARLRWKQAGIRMDARFPTRASCEYYNTWSAGKIF
jgi:hypothetical protein